MPAFITFGRVLFALIFVVSGALKLFDLAGTAKDIADKVVIPALALPYFEQLKTISGMETNQMLAIAAGVVELVCGLMIALNFGVRFFALVLVLYVIGVTFYFHDFWSQAGEASKNNLIHALKNLSIIGALFMIAGYGRGPRTIAEPVYGEV